MNKTNAVQQTRTASSLSPAQGLLQRQCACGNHTVAGGECAACAENKTGLQRKLSIGASNDPLELEADRVADQVVANKASPLSVSGLASGQLQREEAPKEKTNEEKFQAGLEKLGEAFLETPLGKQLLEKIKQDALVKGAITLGKDIISTWPGKIYTGEAAIITVAALAATHKELPVQIPEIPLDILTPGLSVKLTYKGPVDKPTEAMVTFKFTEQAPKGSADKETISATDKYRAETARMAADQDKFRAGLRYPPGSPEDLQQKAEQEAIKKSVLKYPGGPNIEATIKKYPWLATPQSKNDLQLTMPKPTFGAQPPSLFGDEFKLKLPDEQKKKQDEPALQKKLSVGASNDPLEQEADRVADQVMAVPRHSAVNTTLPRIQRFTGQANEGANAAPDSVDRVLAGSARPLEPLLRQDMEARFGYDFSQVRVHTGSAAEQSASDVSANAYTVGHNIVFSTGRFAPGTYEGRRLIAHELTHVVQQSNANKIDQTLQLQSPKASNRWIQRDTNKKMSSLEKIHKLLSTNFFWDFDLAVTDEDARAALDILEKMEPEELIDTVLKMKLSGAWTTLYKELAESDRVRFGGIQMKIDPNVGYLMPNDEIRLDGWLSEQHENIAIPLKVNTDGVRLSMLPEPVPVVGLMPQEAVNVIAKALTASPSNPWSALKLTVVSRGMLYGNQQGPVRGEIGFDAQEIKPSPLSYTAEQNKKHDQFWNYYKKHDQSSVESIETGNLYLSQMKKSLINFEKPEDLWKWAEQQIEKQSAPKREFLNWRRTFERNWEDAKKNDPANEPYTRDVYHRFMIWMDSHTEDDYKKYKAETIAMQCIDAAMSKKWKLNELKIQKDILKKKANESPIDAPKFKQNLNEIITLIEMAILRPHGPHIAEDKTHGVGYLIQPSDDEIKIRRLIADYMLEDYLGQSKSGTAPNAVVFVDGWFQAHPKQLQAFLLVQTKPNVEKYDVPIEIPAHETVIEIGIGFIPIVGEIVGTYEVIAGEDLFGRPLSAEERAVTAALILLPAAAKIFKLGKGVVTASRLARDYHMTPREADAVLRAFTGISPGSAGEKLLREAEADLKAGKGLRNPAQLREINKLLSEMGMTERATADALKTRRANPFANLTEQEIDRALEGIETPAHKGIKKPTMAGKSVPTRQIRRLDIDDLFLRPGETQRQALDRVNSVIGHKISDTPLRDAWEAARTKVLDGRDINTITREEMIGKGGFYDKVRDAFWDEVQANDSAKHYLNNGGFDFTGGRAPLYQTSATNIGDQELRISLDHVDEKAIGENWRKAINADNLRMEFQNPNSFRESIQKKFPELRPTPSTDGMTAPKL
ncbi:DUF4157 domain-containing protein [Nitrosomonas sp.]|uniref:eCIS core domain-containing protein n=1 Tax=Nitrosomonas sp. TaxID=42353 RepID=UPI00262C1BE1|nr:DUF4157 domain-containing protein [Nitrosomonas sp.]